MAAAGTAVSVYSSVQQGQQTEKAANFNAKVAENNALASQQQAEFDVNRIRRKNVLLAGRQRAAAAKSGVELSGSVDDVMFDSSVQGELEAMAALYTGEVAANRERSGGQLSRMQGQNAKETSYYNAGGSILSGAGSSLKIGADYYANQQPTFKGRGRA